MADSKYIKGTANGEPRKWIESIVANPPADCAIWPFTTTWNGYGELLDGTKKLRAHRVALILYCGKDQPNLLACHGPCHNRLCCNPLHLSWETYTENNRDKLRDDTHNRGERHGMSKLTAADVLAIRADSRTNREIAGDYGIAPNHVSRIKNRLRWGWLE